MPLYKTITSGRDTTIHIWKVEQSLAVLSEGVTLSQHCQSRLNSMKSQLHQRAFMSIRHLLALEGYVDTDLIYDAIGKPHLKDGTHISITHSYDFTAIIVSKTAEVGIDVEKQRGKILRIAHKFTPLAEYHTLANEDALVRKLTMVWGAKESIYKICGLQGLSFIQHINVMDFDFEDGRTTAQVNYHSGQMDFDIAFAEFDGFTCAYAHKIKKD